jgi:hypothetical protein
MHKAYDAVQINLMVFIECLSSMLLYFENAEAIYLDI